MKRTTLYFGDDLKRRLERTAKRRGTTEAAIVRDAVARYLASESAPAVRPVGRSTDGGIAHRVDDALDELGFGR